MHPTRWLFIASVLLLATSSPGRTESPDKIPLDFLLPNEKIKTPAHLETPIVFVSRNPQAEWDKLTQFWTVGIDKTTDPATGTVVSRPIVRIKLPLGLTQGPPIPPENPMTLDKWKLGKQLYFDPILSSNATVSCATCHDPATGFSNHDKVSTGIFKKRGGMNSPTVMGSAYNRLQFWDGRAESLEHQAQGPVGNPVEMFDGQGEPWDGAVTRMRKNPEYVKQFSAVFGHLPTRDAAAKAIAAYERTVIIGNSLNDRVDVAMRLRVEEEESTNTKVLPKDYAKVLKDAVAMKDKYSLDAIGFDPNDLENVAKSLADGRTLFFGKARCANCHVGDTMTDHQFHNIGVGVVDGKLPPTLAGRFAQLPLGHKNPEAMGAFKTPTLRGLLVTKPYMHDGSEATIEATVDFYDKGGNANEFLDAKMRDLDAERAYLLAKAKGTTYEGPAVVLCGPNQKPIVPFALKLTPQEKKDLVLFLKAWQGDAVDAMVADPEKGLK